MAERRLERNSIEIPSRIVVTGDTHLRADRTRLPSLLVASIESADLTIHTGDFCSQSSHSLFTRLGRILAVAGNNEELALARSLPGLMEIAAGGRRIILTHGHAEARGSAMAGVTRAYAGRADLVIFGHSHKPCWKEVDGTWFLNPGSPTQKRREPQLSFATLEIGTNGTFDVSFTYFD